MIIARESDTSWRWPPESRSPRSPTEIDVIDDGDASSPVRSEHLGHGLLGMRERAALYGGELVTGPRDGRGFAVHARIPLEAP